MTDPLVSKTRPAFHRTRSTRRRVLQTAGVGVAGLAAAVTWRSGIALALQNGTPQPGGTITYADALDVTSIDPQVSNKIPILFAMVEGLTSVTETGEIEPFLAAGWDANDDASEYTFTLRENIQLHNGRSLTADDVVWSLERTADPNVGAFRGGDLSGVTVEAVDDLTVRVTTPGPNASLPGVLATVFILAPESVGDDGEISEPIGTGPFVFETWSPGVNMRFRKHDAYWRDNTPYADELVYQVIPDTVARLSALRSETVDIVAGVLPTDVPLIANDDAIEIQVATPNIYGHITFNLQTSQEAILDLRVRQAIAHAINKDEVLTIAIGDSDTGAVSNQFYDPTDFWFVDVADEFTEQDQARSRELLSEAGFADNLTVRMLTWGDRRAPAEVIVAHLRDVGVTVDLDYVPDFASYFERLQSLDFDFLFDTAFPGDDPAPRFNFWRAGSPTNLFRAGYSNPDVDELLDAARATTDNEARKAAYAEVLRTFQYEDVATVILYTRKQIWANRTAIQGFTPGTGELNRVDGGIHQTWRAD